MVQFAYQDLQLIDADVENHPDNKLSNATLAINLSRNTVMQTRLLDLIAADTAEFNKGRDAKGLSQQLCPCPFVWQLRAALDLALASVSTWTFQTTRATSTPGQHLEPRGAACQVLRTHGVVPSGLTLDGKSDSATASA